MSDGDGNALAPRRPEPVWRVAPSLEEATEQDVILLTKEGRVLSASQLRAHRAGSWAMAGGIGLLFGAAVATVFGVATGALAGAAFLAVLLWQNRRTPEIRRAVALLAENRHDEARAALEDLEAKRPGWAYQAYIDLLLGKLAWQQGKFPEAQDRYQSAIDTYRRRTNYEGNGMYWICAFDLAELYAASGQVDKAIALRPELDRAPTGEYFQMERMLTDLLIAFHSGSIAKLPDDLYEWAKSALRMNRWGTVLVLLSWAFVEQGDEEMARHVLGEAPDRLEEAFAAAHPKEQQWMQARLGEWNLEL